MKDQIQRAAISVMSNIAEGFERKTNPDFMRFLYIAKGSTAEVRSQLMAALDQEYLCQEDYSLIYNEYESLASMISSLIKYLTDCGDGYGKKQV